MQDRLQIARQNQNVQQTMMQRQHQHGHWTQPMPVPQYHQHQHPHQHQHQHQHHHQYQEAPRRVDSGYHGGYQGYNQHHIAQDYGQYDGGAGDYADKNLVS